MNENRVLDILRNEVPFGTRQTCKRRTGWLFLNQTGLKIAGKHKRQGKSKGTKEPLIQTDPVPKGF